MSLVVSNPNTDNLISQAVVPLESIAVCAHDAGGNFADILTKSSFVVTIYFF